MHIFYTLCIVSHIATGIVIDFVYIVTQQYMLTYCI